MRADFTKPVECLKPPLLPGLFESFSYSYHWAQHLSTLFSAQYWWWAMRAWATHCFLLVRTGFGHIHLFWHMFPVLVSVSIGLLLAFNWSDLVLDSISHFFYDQFWCCCGGESIIYLQTRPIQITLKAMFRRAVSTIEGVKADALFSYQPPLNLFALVIMLPASYILSPRWFHKVNVFMIRWTHILASVDLVPTAHLLQQADPF